MRKSLLLLICFIVPLCCLAEIVIDMEKDGNVYRVPCLVNGAKMKMIFDTGASSVSLSLPIAEYLYDNGYISDADFRGNGKTIVADGGIVDHLKINLNEIDLGGIKINNVEAVVVSSQNAPLLLGQSAIAKLGRIQISGNRLVILDKGTNIAQTELSEDEIDSMFTQGDEYYKADYYSKALPIYELLNKHNLLSEAGKLRLYFCYFRTQNYDKCIPVLESIDEWHYNLYGMAYEYMGDRDEAIYFYNKFLNQCLDNNDLDGIAHTYYNIGSLYYDWGSKQKDTRKSLEYLRKALHYFERLNDIPSGDLWKHCIGDINNQKVEQLRKNDGAIDFLIYFLAESNYEEAEWSFDGYVSTLKALAKNRNKMARDMCEKMSIYIY